MVAKFVEEKTDEEKIYEVEVSRWYLIYRHVKDSGIKEDELIFQNLTELSEKWPDLQKRLGITQISFDPVWDTEKIKQEGYTPKPKKGFITYLKRYRGGSIFEHKIAYFCGECEKTIVGPPKINLRSQQPFTIEQSRGLIYTCKACNNIIYEKSVERTAF